MRRFVLPVFLSLYLIPSAFAQGTVKGHVTFEGTPPPPEKVSVTSDMPTCGSEKEIRRLVLGQDRGVADAVVTLVGAEGPVSPRDGSLDQVTCEFKPHVQVIPVGSTLRITSSDSVLHNSHGFYEDGTTAFNLAVPVVGMEMTFKAEKPGLIKLRCDAGHTWMSAYVMVTDKPFTTQTDANGDFSFEGVPPGRYEIEVWQEWLGRTRLPLEVKAGEQTVSIPLRKTEPADGHAAAVAG